MVGFGSTSSSATILRFDLVPRCCAGGLEVSWEERVAGTAGGVAVVWLSGGEEEPMGSVGATSSEIGEEEEGEGNPVSSKVAGEVTVVATTSSVVGVEGGIEADVSGTSSMSVARAVV